MNPKVQAILEQTGRLYHRYGIKSITMDDVASHLGMSKKTLYECFSDKEDLVRQVLMYDHSRYCALLDGIEEKNLNAVEELFEVYRSIQAIYREYNPSMDYDIRKYYPGLFIELRDIKRKRMYESVFRNLIKGRSEGLYRVDLDPSVIARMHVMRVESMLYNDIFTVEELTSFSLFHESFVYHMHGIMSHEGRVFFEASFDLFTAAGKETP